MEYYVYVTNDCNLNCEYCSVMLKKNQSKLPMNISYSLINLKKFIDKIQKKYNHNIATIYFFGGEPTLKYDIIDEIIDLFDMTNDYKTEFVLHTNGILLNAIPENILKKIDLIFLSVNYERMISENHVTDYYAHISDSVSKIKIQKNIPIHTILLLFVQMLLNLL